MANTRFTEFAKTLVKKKFEQFLHKGGEKLSCHARWKPPKSLGDSINRDPGGNELISSLRSQTSSQVAKNGDAENNAAHLDEFYKVG